MGEGDGVRGGCTGDGDRGRGRGRGQTWGMGTEDGGIGQRGQGWRIGDRHRGWGQSIGTGDRDGGRGQAWVGLGTEDGG